MGRIVVYGPRIWLTRNGLARRLVHEQPCHVWEHLSNVSMIMQAQPTVTAPGFAERRCVISAHHADVFVHNACAVEIVM